MSMSRDVLQVPIYAIIVEPLRGHKDQQNEPGDVRTHCEGFQPSWN